MTTSGESAAPRRKLPIRIQTWRAIREDGCYHVDKTDCVRRLVDGGQHYFLPRPRARHRRKHHMGNFSHTIKYFRRIATEFAKPARSRPAGRT